MNYRHAFHAGNFADCVKHAVLIWLLTALHRKPAPFFVLDTHAGTGHYDLTDGPAERTGEWHHGIACLLENPPPPLIPYVDLVKTLGLYPGSPVIIRALLREQDRLAACELHPEDAAALRRRFARDPQVAVHHRDGWDSLTALLPPAQKRGLVLIDPPYEALDEHTTLLEGLRASRARFPTAIHVGWYPIKHRTPVRDLHDAIRASGPRDAIAAELLLRLPTDPTRLNGCGLIIINPPFRAESELDLLLAAMSKRLSNDPDVTSHILRLTDE
jgi:23S rRNA (adenine2030-N6)-methyltransferase